MSVFVVYKPVSEHARTVEEFLHDFERRTARKLDTVNPESREGAEKCRTYGIVEYPSVVALSENGQVLNLWRGIPMPLIDEVSYYVL